MPTSTENVYVFVPRSQFPLHGTPPPSVVKLDLSQVTSVNARTAGLSSIAKAAIGVCVVAFVAALAASAYVIVRTVTGTKV
ncbi:unnamed protein product [Didymodactylos carnosus]|uniref:Uncharacterized protein n=1 Tax=Didymodactylos carnosus TaxID=1234261 RepID=A0A815V0P4_9BILA|nr:unnamed protein product [Didymodactylos carnosus]CAF1528213.1 unnamed protein product [Didymodactylos carnosus]CAF4207723.1 unnamed protein product [Didymodactylos carnosus]CAF4387354.1 unnamed protein product [Didymodactylos carnosus]